MTADEKKILLEHKQMMMELQQDFQKFYQIASKIIPEIQRTQTMYRLDAEFEEFKRKSLESS